LTILEQQVPNILSDEFLKDDFEEYIQLHIATVQEKKQP
jgi:hypothetical protein